MQKDSLVREPVLISLLFISIQFNDIVKDGPGGSSSAPTGGGRTLTGGCELGLGVWWAVELKLTRKRKRINGFQPGGLRPPNPPPPRSAILFNCIPPIEDAYLQLQLARHVGLHNDAGQQSSPCVRARLNKVWLLTISLIYLAVNGE